jgi:hypothetical protein
MTNSPEEERHDLPSRFAVFSAKNGRPDVVARFENDDVWLTQEHLARLYGTTKQNVSQHLKAIFESGELDAATKVKKFFTMGRKEGQVAERPIYHYCLDVIIALGYRIDSPVAIRFRQWATERLHELIQKGFALEDERLKQGGNRYFKELLQRIRDIRASERNFYQQVTDVYATATDYDPRADITREFFATVQNKMHYAVHEHTAAEVVYDRVDNAKPNVGMTSFRGDYVTRDDVRIAKNYLTENELSRLNLLVSQFLDFAEYKALSEEPMSMADWIAALDDQLKRLRARLLVGKGRVTHDEAMKKAEAEFEIYRAREMRQLKSDFDKAVSGYLRKNGQDSAS